MEAQEGKRGGQQLLQGIGRQGGNLNFAGWGFIRTFVLQIIHLKNISEL